MKKVIFAFALFTCAAPVHSQLLKKLKDKVNKTIDKTSGNDSGSSSDNNSSSSSANEDNPKTSWCDGIKAGGGSGGGAGTDADGVSYTLAYSSPNRIDIVYTESSVSLGNSTKGYRLILTERVNNKQQFVVVENGKVVSTDNTVKAEYVVNSGYGEFSSSNPGNNDADMQKYIVADSLKHTVAKTDATSVKVTKIDEDRFAMAMNVARQSDEYKNLSAEEKKEFEAAIKEGLKQNNAMAGQTFSTPGQQGGSYSTVTGYKLIVKGKNYGKFTFPPAVFVSSDETIVFAVGTDEEANPVLIYNGKKTALDQNKFTGINGRVIKSSDGKKFVYMEMKKMDEEEITAVSSGSKKISYTVLRPDGTNMLVTDYTSSGKFVLTSSGAVVSVDQSTGDVFIDGKKAGRFILKDGNTLESDALLIGADATKIAYYDGASGSINYIDGSSKKLGVLYPKVVFENGKSYLKWFRKCKNEIYIGSFEY